MRTYSPSLNLALPVHTRTPSNRCFTNGLGGPLQCDINWREKHKRRGRKSHQYTRVDGSQTGNFNFCKNSNVSIHLQLDKKTASSYVMKIESNHNRHLLDINKSVYLVIPLSKKNENDYF